MVKAVLFDMDGTMLDTEPISAECWKKAGKELGYIIEDRFMNTLFGKNIASIEKMLQEEFGIQEEAVQIIDKRLMHYKNYLAENGVPKKKGLMEVLEYLKHNNIPAVVCTSTEKATAENVLKKAGIYEYFTGYVYGDMVTRSKPDPQGFHMAAELAGQKPSECLVVEDSPNGVLAGKAAGGHIIFIPDCIEMPEGVLDGITAQLNDLNELIEWLEKNK